MRVLVEKSGGIVKIVIYRRGGALYKVAPADLLEEAEFLGEVLRECNLPWVSDVKLYRGCVTIQIGDRIITIQNNSDSKLAAGVLNVIEKLGVATGAFNITITGDIVLLTTKRGIIRLQDWMKRALRKIKHGEEDEHVIIIDKDDERIIKELAEYFNSLGILKDGV